MRKGSHTSRPRRWAKAVDVTGWQDHDYDDEAELYQMHSRARPSIDDCVEQLLEEDAPDSNPEREAGAHTATVTAISAGVCQVQLEDGSRLPCRLPSDLVQTQKTDLAVGDLVSLALDEPPDAGVVCEVFPRRTSLSRPDPSAKGKVLERVIVANVDLVLIVAAAKTPPLRPRLLDRYLIAIERGGATPVICVNKADLLSDAERQEVEAVLDVYRNLGISVVLCSAQTGVGVDELRARIRGSTCAFVGHSGVGKTSTLNRLAPGLAAETGDVSDVTGRGRHTTTRSELYDLGDQTRLIDTPGVRQFGLWKLTAPELRWYFPEFQEPSRACRFADCSHTHEPDCAVRAALAAGDLDARRYDTYVRLYRDLGG